MMARPYMANDWHALAHEAEEALRRREVRLPILVEQGKMDEAIAATELRVWAAIHGDWHWVVLHTRPNAIMASQQEKIDALTESLRRCTLALRKEQDRAPGDVLPYLVDGANMLELDLIIGPRFAPLRDAHYQRDRVEALLWYQHPDHNAALHEAVSATIAFRERERRARHQAAA